MLISKPQKYQEVGLSSDLEVSCSLQLNMVELDRFKESPLGVLITVDSQNYLRMFTVNQESSELIAAQKLSIEEDDKVISVNFFIKAKSLIVSSEKGKCFIVTCERDLSEQTNIMSYFKDQERKSVTYTSAITVKGDHYFAVGLSTGELVLKYHQ